MSEHKIPASSGYNGNGKAGGRGTMEGRNKKDEKQKKKRNYKYLRANGEKRKE